MNIDKAHKRVITYYERSKFGYDIVLHGAKHFGFYPNKIRDISSKEAEDRMHDFIAKNLNIKENQLILDAGCGQGVVSRYLANKYNCKIIGITIVPYEQKRANAWVKKSGLNKKLGYYLMDYSNTKFKSNTFDAVYAIESLVHSPDADKTLKEFLRILRPNGRLVIFDYTIAGDERFTKHEKEMLDIIIDVVGMWAMKEMRHDQFTKRLRKIGFESIKEHDITDYVFPSFERLRDAAKILYYFVKLFRLERRFIDITIPNELYAPINRGLIRYCVFTASKPQKSGF